MSTLVIRKQLPLRKSPGSKFRCYNLAQSSESQQTIQPRNPPMYTVLGASGHIGSVITKALLEKGEKVRVFGRHSGKLQSFVQKGAESIIAERSEERRVG